MPSPKSQNHVEAVGLLSVNCTVDDVLQERVSLVEKSTVGDAITETFLITESVQFQ